jgi:hypothetical protein
LKGNLLIATEALKEDLEIDLESAKESIEQLNEFRQKDKERYETENQN